MTRPGEGVLRSWSPRAHVTAERHWLNDPNGLIEVDGTYHVFFQENPHEPFWGAPHWGHVSSTDLVRWRRHPPALSPGGAGPDRDGCWSGCARVVDGVPALYYTGVVGDGADRVESVCRATGSPDLTRWTRDPANPLVPGPPPGARSVNHRDPFLWRDGAGWHLVLSSDLDGRGAALVYDSPDARAWSYGGVLFAEPDPRPPGAAEVECVQLARFAGADVLVASVQVPGAPRPLSHVDYVVGTLAGTWFRARARGRLDGGDALYAPAVMVDGRGRHLLWGWAQEDLDPAVQARLPVAGALTLPRVLSLDGDTLRSEPAAELAGLRAEPLGALPAGGTRRLPAAAALHLELAADLGGTGTARLALAVAGEVLTVTADLGGRLAVTVAGPGGELRLDRTVPVRPGGGPLTVYRDGSLVEVFHGGQAVTTRWYAGTVADLDLTLTPGPGVTCRDAAAWTLRDAVDRDGHGVG